MRVMIAASVSPFCAREEMHWAQAIASNLRERKIEVDWFMLPIVHNPLLIPEQMTALRLLDIEDSCDLLLTIGFPAFILKHSNKRVLLFSLAPSLHEHFNTEFGILATSQYQRIRGAVHKAEKICLQEAKKVVCASKTMAAQLLADLNINAVSVIPGDRLEDKSLGKLPENGAWIVCESMLEPAERMDLLLDAVNYSDQDWYLAIFVPSASDVYRRAIDNRIERLNLQGRVVINDVPLPTDDLKRSSAFIALNFASTRIPESALRAIKSSIPILTTSDCGALLEIISHGTNGFIIEPSVRKICESLDNIVADKQFTKRLAVDNHLFIDNISDVNSIIDILM